MSNERPRPAVIVLMLLVTVWSGALAAGFGWAVATASDRLGSSRVLVFTLAGGLLAVLAVRTAYELVRSLRRS